MSSTPTTDPSNLSSISSISYSDNDGYSATGSDDEIVWSLSELSSQSHSMSASLTLSSPSDLSATESFDSVRPASDASDEDYVVLTHVRARSRARRSPDRPVDALANDFKAFSIGASTSTAPTTAAKDWTAAGTYAPKFVKAKEPQSYPSLASRSSYAMLDPEVAKIARRLGILRDSTKANTEVQAEVQAEVQTKKVEKKAARHARKVAKAEEAAKKAAATAAGSPTASTANVASRARECPLPTCLAPARSPSVATVKPAASTMTATANAEAKAQRRKAARQRAKARKAAKKKVGAAAAGKPTSGTTALVSALTPSYKDAATFISKYISDPEQHGEKASKLTLLHALLVELGICTTPSTPCLPASLRGCTALLRSRVFLNIRDYLAVRDQGMAALQRVMFPSRSALVNNIRKEKRSVPLKSVKKHGLQVLLVTCFY